MIAKGGEGSGITLVQLLAVLCLAFLCAPGLQGLSQEDAVDWPRLERGDILVATATSRSGTPGLRCLLLVSGSQAELFSRIRDPLFFEASYRNIEELRVLRTYPDGANIEFVLDAIVRKVRYTVARTVDDEKYEVDWSRISGDLKDISGLWAVKESPVPGKCLIIYESYVDPGSSLEVAVYSAFARTQAHSLLERLRTILEEHKG